MAKRAVTPIPTPGAACCTDLFAPDTLALSDPVDDEDDDDPEPELELELELLPVVDTDAVVLVGSPGKTSPASHCEERKRKMIRPCAQRTRGGVGERREKAKKRTCSTMQPASHRNRSTTSPKPLVL